MTFSTRLAVLVVAIGTIGCDQVTKQAARSHLVGKPRQSFVADVVRLEYAENPGAFLGFGAAWPEAVRRAVFTIGTGAILLCIAVTSFAARSSNARRLALGLVWAGGA